MQVYWRNRLEVCCKDIMTLMLKGLLNCVESVGLDPKIEFFRNTKKCPQVDFQYFQISVSHLCFFNRDK